MSIADLLAAGPPLVFAAIKETIRMTENLKVEEAFTLMHGKGIPAVNTLIRERGPRGGHPRLRRETPPGLEGSMIVGPPRAPGRIPHSRTHPADLPAPAGFPLPVRRV